MLKNFDAEVIRGDAVMISNNHDTLLVSVCTSPLSLRHIVFQVNDGVLQVVEDETEGII